MTNYPPSSKELRHLRARNSTAFLHLLFGIVSVSGGVLLAIYAQNPLLYVISQLILAIAFIHSFILLHEAGHHTLFKQVWLNEIIGYLSGFVALIPYSSWRPIHNRHHYYTGWQDLDATTTTLVPRSIATWEKHTINVAWQFWLPLFSILYRLQNYWHLPRVIRFLEKKARPIGLYFNAVIMMLAYCTLFVLTGVMDLLVTIGPGLFLSLMAQDIILLSQHTHMPTNLSKGEKVRPFPHIRQSPFTRSLSLPAWFSSLIMHFDAHELHHMYPAVPGYLLKRIPYTPPNEINWIVWIRAAKMLSGTAFLFGKREDTGMKV